MRSGVLVNARLSMLSFLSETSIVTKSGCALLGIFYCLSFAVEVNNIFAITPGHLVPPKFWIWTILTYPFVETNFISFLINLAVLLASVKIVESNMSGLSSFLIFFSIVTSVSGLVTFFNYLFAYIFTFNISYLFDVHIYGLYSYIGAALVSFKQSRGDQMVIGSIGLCIKNLPLVYVCFLVFMKLVHMTTAAPVLLGLNGIIVAWVYLRFYQSHSKGRGDQAAHFAFKTFFPKPMHGPVGVISNWVYKLLLLLKICRKTSYRYDVGAPSKFTITLSGADAFDAERRRNKAIKALDERLQKQDQLMVSEDWPDIEGDDEETPEVQEKAEEKSVNIEIEPPTAPTTTETV